MAQCSGTNKKGERCNRTAGPSGLCIVHDGSGRLNMRAIGQKGGRPAAGDKALSAALPADDPLRTQAREELQRLLTSDNEQVRL
jgi:Family of unknown function (DUF5763)